MMIFELLFPSSSSHFFLSQYHPLAQAFLNSRNNRTTTATTSAANNNSGHYGTPRSNNINNNNYSSSSTGYNNKLHQNNSYPSLKSPSLMSNKSQPPKTPVSVYSSSSSSALKSPGVINNSNYKRPTSPNYSGGSGGSGGSSSSSPTHFNAAKSQESSSEEYDYRNNPFYTLRSSGGKSGRGTGGGRGYPKPGLSRASSVGKLVNNFEALDSSAMPKKKHSLAAGVNGLGGFRGPTYIQSNGGSSSSSSSMVAASGNKQQVLPPKPPLTVKPVLRHTVRDRPTISSLSLPPSMSLIRLKSLFIPISNLSLSFN